MKKLLIAFLLTVATACFAGGPSSSGAQFSDPVPVANGGTGASLASEARANLAAYGSVDAAALAARVATCESDISTKAGINGSSTVNFAIATATVRNITGLQIFKAHHTGTPPIGIGGVWEVFDPATDDISNTNYSNGTWTAPVTGVYRINGVVQTGAIADTKYVFVRSVVNGSPTTDYFKTSASVDGDALFAQFCYLQKLISGQTFSVQTTTNNTSDPLMTGGGCWLQIEQIR